ncbi:MAG: hypothetical protein Q8M31_09895 [Beijerinckiaceae bacterium]|nr:hypothetical protein [Beijerinckiaceae bacterium]
MALVLRPPPGRDPFIRMVIVNWIVGACLGVAFAAVILAADVGGMHSLMLGHNISITAIALLFGGFAITFGGVVAATAIMLIKEDDDNDGGRSNMLQPVPVPTPARVRVRR